MQKKEFIKFYIEKYGRSTFYIDKFKSPKNFKKMPKHLKDVIFKLSSEVDLDKYKGITILSNRFNKIISSEFLSLNTKEIISKNNIEVLELDTNEIMASMQSFNNNDHVLLFSKGFYRFIYESLRLINGFFYTDIYNKTNKEIDFVKLTEALTSLVYYHFEAGVNYNPIEVKLPIDAAEHCGSICDIIIDFFILHEISHIEFQNFAKKEVMSTLDEEIFCDSRAILNTIIYNTRSKEDVSIYKADKLLTGMSYYFFIFDFIEKLGVEFKNNTHPKNQDRIGLIETMIYDAFKINVTTHKELIYYPLLKYYFHFINKTLSEETNNFIKNANTFTEKLNNLLAKYSNENLDIGIPEYYRFENEMSKLFQSAYPHKIAEICSYYKLKIINLEDSQEKEHYLNSLKLLNRFFSSENFLDSKLGDFYLSKLK